MQKQIEKRVYHKAETAQDIAPLPEEAVAGHPELDASVDDVLLDAERELMLHDRAWANAASYLLTIS